MFGKPIFTPPLDRNFGWMGLVGLLAGLVSGMVVLALSFGGWDLSRLWFYLLGSAMLILIGFQLIIYWVLMRVLENLSQRETFIRQDMQVQGRDH
jgi:hypothetical protein